LHNLIAEFLPDFKTPCFLLNFNLFTLSGHVLALILLVSLVGMGMEMNLFHALYRWSGHSSLSHLSDGGSRKKQVFIWYFWTIFAFFGSLLIGINFILGILEIPSRPSTGKE
jgi:hypothetical protein